MVGFDRSWTSARLAFGGVADWDLLTAPAHRGRLVIRFGGRVVSCQNTLAGLPKTVGGFKFRGFAVRDDRVDGRLAYARLTGQHRLRDPVDLHGSFCFAYQGWWQCVLSSLAP